MKTLNDLKNAIKEQELSIREILLSEIENGDKYQIIEQHGKELSVYQIVELQFFQEKDLVENFLNENDPEQDEYSLEELRDIQHESVMNLADIIDRNQNFRDSLKSGYFGNKNAEKDSEEKAESHIHVRCNTSDKARWVKASQRENRRLSAWIVDTLNEKSNCHSN